VPTAGIIGEAERTGKRVFLPRFRGDRIEFGEYGPRWPLRSGRYGIQEASGPSFQCGGVEEIVVLCPLVAWDARGVRLGRGGGHYDRALAELRKQACLVGLGYQWQEYATLPVDPWDVLVDYVATEAGVVRCAGGTELPANRREEEQCHGGVCMDRGYRLSGGRTRMVL
jgi:5-formyltetrahydrofolate cyclo-ligase